MMKQPLYLPDERVLTVSLTAMITYQVFPRTVLPAAGLSFLKKGRKKSRNSKNSCASRPDRRMAHCQLACGLVIVDRISCHRSIFVYLFFPPLSLPAVGKADGLASLAATSQFVTI